MRSWVVVAGTAAFLGCRTELAPPAPAAAPAFITNGERADVCQWPNTVALVNADGKPYCTGTLVHPRAVLTAAHCIANSGVPVSIGFGEDSYAPVRSVPASQCRLHPRFGAEPSVDLAVCELVDPIDDVQTVPVIMGCEADVLTPEAEVAIVGFGNEQSRYLGNVYQSGFGEGPKRWVAQSLFEVRADEAMAYLHPVEGMTGGCHGDSGGGAFVRLADGTWRLFGVAQGVFDVPDWPPETDGESGGGESGGFIQPPEEGIEVCGYGTTYSLVAPEMAWIEAVVGTDLTPCFDPAGAWDPSLACTPFPLDTARSGGDWAQGCTGRLGGEPQCGTLPEPETSTDTDTDTSVASSTDDATTANATTSGSEGSETTAGADAQHDAGCGCGQRRFDTGWPWMLAILVATVAPARRRSRAGRLHLPLTSVADRAIGGARSHGA